VQPLPTARLSFDAQIKGSGCEGGKVTFKRRRQNLAAGKRPTLPCRFSQCRCSAIAGNPHHTNILHPSCTHLSLHKKRQELASSRYLTDILNRPKVSKCPITHPPQTPVIIAIVGGDATSSLCGHDVVLHRHWLNIGID
jgi:hypothetical protein